MSKLHLAQALSERGNSVYFVDPPISGAQGLSIMDAGRVHVVRYHHWLRGVNQLPLALNRWYYRQLIQRIARSTGGAFDIVWCFDTSRMQAFPQGIGLRLLHLADYDILHMGRGLIPSADIIFTTGQVVADAVAPQARCSVVNMGHALDARWLEGAELLADRAARPVQEALFMGQLANSYNDWEGFDRVVASHPELRFVHRAIRRWTARARLPCATEAAKRAIRRTHGEDKPDSLGARSRPALLWFPQRLGGERARQSA
ncbi:MAG: hypothetical protein IPJ85_00550 [Flavobacteriales bacterium]|nr:hypothetical protein [Flavobacteriales bacterium]